MVFNDVFFFIQTDQITDSPTTNEALAGKEDLQDSVDLIINMYMATGFCRRFRGVGKMGRVRCRATGSISPLQRPRCKAQQRNTSDCKGLRGEIQGRKRDRRGRRGDKRLFYQIFKRLEIVVGH